MGRKASVQCSVAAPLGVPLLSRYLRSCFSLRCKKNTTMPTRLRARQAPRMIPVSWMGEQPSAGWDSTPQWGGGSIPQLSRRTPLSWAPQTVPQHWALPCWTGIAVPATTAPRNAGKCPDRSRPVGAEPKASEACGKCRTVAPWTP